MSMANESLDDRYDPGRGFGSSVGEGYSGSVPTIPYGGNIDLGSVAPVLGVMGNEHGNAEYLDYNLKGRSASERIYFNCGISYLTGISLGGLYGLGEGLRSSPSPKMKVRINSILNACGKRGSRLGNGVGILAMTYSAFEAIADNYELERFMGGNDSANSVVAATAAGLLYKSTAGPRAMALAGALGFGLSAAYVGITKLLSEQTGSRR